MPHTTMIPFRVQEVGDDSRGRHFVTLIGLDARGNPCTNSKLKFEVDKEQARAYARAIYQTVDVKLTYGVDG